MRQFVLTLSLITLLGLSGLRAQSTFDVMSVWRDSTLTIDGRSNEWPSFFRFYMSGAKVQFDFYNDSANIYVCLKAVDVEAQYRLMHTGVDFWFDPLGKKKQKIGFSFPLKLERAPGDGPKRVRADSDPSKSPTEKSMVMKLKQQVVFAQSFIKVIGMPAVTEPQIPLQNKYGIDIAYDWDSLNILSIEYKVPLALILQHPVVSTDFDHTMGMGIIVGAMENTRPSGAPQSSTAGGGGGMGSGGNGMGGGGRGGRGSASQQNNLANDRFNTDLAEQKIWLKVHLENKPAK